MTGVAGVPTPTTFSYRRPDGDTGPMMALKEDYGRARLESSQPHEGTGAVVARADKFVDRKSVV